jgi:oligopeptide transport system ATP-binding protein
MQGGSLMTPESYDKILEVKGLKKYFPVEQRTLFGKKLFIKAVDGVDLSIRKGETLGIVGESGCGKSTLGRTILRLTEPTEGSIIFEGQDVTRIPRKEFKAKRKDMQIMFQDPYASLSPRMTVGNIIAEPIDIQKKFKNKAERIQKILELMDICGLDNMYINRYPHEFSGGQRQRIGIARALALNPKLIVCDEPVSALDVSIQSQIINLLVDLQKQYALTLIFISHDLSVIHHISDRVAVMYLGKIVELADKEEIFKNPKHPYTIALLESIPKVGGAGFDEHKFVLEGDIPSPVNPPPGCPFHTRCPSVFSECSAKIPQLQDSGGNHMVSCLLCRH